MESKISSDLEKKDSPSHDENIAHLQSMKRDIESLEDFEDITKDVPSMKDITAQFLQFEVGDKYSSSNKGFSPKDDHFKFEANQNNDFPSFAPSNVKEFGGTFENSQSDMNLDFLEPFNKQGQPMSDVRQSQDDDPFNSLINIEESNKEVKKLEDDFLDFLQNEQKSNLLDDRKLLDGISNDDNSTASEDLSYIPKKGESSPVLTTDLDRSLPKELGTDHNSGLDFQSLQAKINDSDTSTKLKQEPEIKQGDGLHLKENDGDTSDNDDFVPEPIPKDYPEIRVIEGKQFLAAFGLDTWFHPELLNPKVESLVYWRDPKKSGIVFGSILIILLSLTSFSLISVVAYTSLTALVAALAFRIYKNVLQAVQKTSEGHPFNTHLLPVLNHPSVTAVFLTIKEYLEIDLTINPDRAREISDVVVSNINKAVAQFRRLFLVEDVIDSIKFGILLWCLTYVGAWFNGLSLLIIAYVGLFTLPKVYENNQAQIDANIDIVKTKINEITDKIRAVIPMGKKAEEAKDKAE